MGPWRTLKDSKDKDDDSDNQEHVDQVIAVIGGDASYEGVSEHTQ